MRFILTIPDELKNRLELAADMNAVSQATVIRVALTEFLNKRQIHSR